MMIRELYTCPLWKQSSIPDTQVILVNTTSTSTEEWSKYLSPFFVPCGNLYGHYIAKNVENAWQFSKVYKEFVDEQNKPTKEYFIWAQQGWSDSYAHRYPMGRGRTPLYLYWLDDINIDEYIVRYWDYIHARQRIYVPLYCRVVLTEAYKHLFDLYMTQQGVMYLLDYDVKLMPNTQNDICHQHVLHHPQQKYGHAYILYALLQEQIPPYTDPLVAAIRVLSH